MPAAKRSAPVSARAAAPPAPRVGRRPRAAAGAAQADLRTRLLDAAADLFGERGVAATTTAQIAARAGVTAAMVHYHFRSRASLLDAFAAERLLPFLHEVWDPVAEADRKDAAGMVVALAMRLLEGAQARPWLPPLWMREIASTGGELRSRVVPHLPARAMAALAEAVALGQRRGRVAKGLEPQLLFLTVLGSTLLPLATAAIWQTVVSGPAAVRAALARHVRTVIVNAMRPGP